MKRESFISRKTNWGTTKEYYRYFYPDSSILHKRLIFHMILYRHVCVNYRIKWYYNYFTDKRELDKDGKFVLKFFHSDEGLKNISLFRWKS
jgi:hypothetical protein